MSLEGTALEDDVAMRQQCALRRPRGAGGVDDDRHVAGFRDGDAAFPFLRVVAGVGFAAGAELAEQNHLRVCKLAQAFHVEHDDLLQMRRALAHGQDLVELLLVLHEQELGLAVVDQILDLRRRVGRVDAREMPAAHSTARSQNSPLLVVVGQDGDAISGSSPNEISPMPMARALAP